MRYAISTVTIAFLLGCSGVLDKISSGISTASPPESFACPAEATPAGGVWPLRQELWQQLPHPAPIYDDDLGRWLEIDEGLERVHNDMMEGDEHWWCEQADGTVEGPYIALHPLPTREEAPEGTVREIKGQFKDGMVDGDWLATLQIPDAPPIPWVQGRFAHGSQDGDWVYYCGIGCAGEITLEASYGDSQPHGTWHWYDGDNEEIVATYAMGALEGPYQHRWGNTILEGSFTNGERDSGWTEREGESLASNEDTSDEDDELSEGTDGEASDQEPTPKTKKAPTPATGVINGRPRKGLPIRGRGKSKVGKIKPKTGR